MKTKTLARLTVKLLAALVLAIIVSTPVHALTVFCPTNRIAECGSWSFDMPSTADPCCTNVSIIPVTNYSSGATCNSAHTQVWLVSDCCTNVTCSQTVTVMDTTAPELTWFPDKTNECSEPLTFDRPLAQDACCPSNSLSWVTNVVLISSNQCQIVWLATWQVNDCCGNSNVAWQNVTLVDSLKPEIYCPPDQVIPYGAAWDFGGPPTVWDNCCPSNSLIVQPGIPQTNVYTCSNIITRAWSATDCCNNTATCTQTVTVITCPAAPTLTAVLSGGQLHLGWGPVPREFYLQRVPGLGGTNPPWLPGSGLPTASWSRFNQTSNALEQFFSADIPRLPGLWPPNQFLRLASDPAIHQDFSVLPTGVFSNPPAGPTSVPWTFSPMGAGSMQIVDINNTHALLVDDQGIELRMDTNRSAWPNVLTGAPNLHEMHLAVIFAQSNAQPMELKGFDVTGQLVSSIQFSNLDYGSVTQWSKGWPFGRFEFKMPGGGTSSIPRLDIVSDFTTPLVPNCTDLGSYPTGAVSNPWVQPGFTITATNSSGQLEANTYIEAGPEGNGYHVEYLAQIEFPNNTCCRKIEVTLARASESVEVEVTAYDASVTVVLGRKQLTVAEGNPTVVTFPPTSQPICSIIVKAPTGQTRIMKICCLPAD